MVLQRILVVLRVSEKQLRLEGKKSGHARSQPMFIIIPFVFV